MVQPKDPPLSVRFRPGLLERVKAYASAAGITPNAAIQDFIEDGLDAASGKGPPGKLTAREAAALAEEKTGVPTGPASSVPLAPGKYSEVRRDTGAQGWFAPKKGKS